MIAVKQNYVKDNIVRVKSLSFPYSDGVPKKYLNTIASVVEPLGLWLKVTDGKNQFLIDKNDLELVTDLNIIQEFKDRVVNLISNLDKQLIDIHNILNEVYGEENVDRQDKIFVFKIPSIPITNGKIKHTITDFYTRLTFKLNDDGTTYLLSVIEGNRGTITFAEYCGNYGFSHLSNSYNWGNFCFGVKFNTPIKDLVNDLMIDGYNYDTFLIWCYSFKTYLGWESVEGVPYRHLNSVQIGGGYKITKNNIKDSKITEIYKKFIKSKVKPEFKLSIDNYEVIQNQQFNDLVNSVAPDSLKIPYNSLTKEYVEGLDIPRIKQAIKDFNQSRSNDIIFKDIKTHCTIVDNFNTQTTDTLYLPIDAINRVKMMIEENYNKWLKKKSLKKHEYYISKVY